MVECIDYAAVLVEGVDFGRFVEHGVEEMHAFVAHGADVEHGFAQRDGEFELAEGEVRLETCEVFQCARVILQSLRGDGPCVRGCRPR